LKTLKRIYLWILISVMVQVAVLSYVNFIYLPGRGAVRTTAYEEDAAAVKNRSFKLPAEASGTTVSFDGLNAAYRKGDSLVIVDLDTRKTVRELDPKGGQFTFFRWLPDRDMLIYAVKEPEGKSGQVLISTYDIGPALDRSYPVIKELSEGSEVTDIVLSPLTNIVYPKVKTSETKAKIYRFDIMDNLKFIFSTSASTAMFETMYSDSLVYQAPDGKTKVRNGRSGKTGGLPVKEATKLLAVDDNDFIYAAAADKNGNLTALYSGKAEQKQEEWETLKLEKPLKAENIYITAGGSIYYADAEAGKIQNLEGTAETEYQGRLLTVLDQYVVSVDANKLILKTLKKE
jgi:hypothetical protein